MAASCPPRRGCGRWRAQDLFPRGLRRTQPREEVAGSRLGEGPEGADPRAPELRDRLELELQQQGKEHYECVLKLKEQHLAEVTGWGRAERYNRTKSTPSAQQRASG